MYHQCMGCGYCCKKMQCIISYSIHGRIDRCPELVKKEGRYWCKLVLEGSKEKRLQYKMALHIGEGCSSSMNTDRTKMVCEAKSG